MTILQLTDRAEAAKIAGMVGQERTGRRLVPSVVGAVALAAGLAACVSVKAPDKPIVIELNINIRQEVIYRLAEDADKTINENADIF